LGEELEALLWGETGDAGEDDFTIWRDLFAV
jgi:hypothetical protein